MNTFVHAADVHLDSPLRGLERYEGAPVDAIRSATRRAFENLVDLCIQLPADFLLLAGDLFDGDWQDYGTGLFMVQQFRRLGAQDISVFVVRGNHDAESRLTKNLSMPDNVVIFPADSPASHVIERGSAVVHGQSYPEAAVTEDLSRGYPDPRPGLLNVGLLHTSLDGRPGHAPYAPCTPHGLAQKGYQYWALGHVHHREVVSDDPWIVFSGNLQGRHAREKGPKGATVVTHDGGTVFSVTHRDLDVVRWSEITLTCAPFDLHACLARVGDELAALVDQNPDRLCAVRVHVRTEAGAAVAQLEAEVRSLALNVSESAPGPGVWVERVKVTSEATAPAHRDRAQPAPVHTVQRIMDEFPWEEELTRILDDMRARIPQDIIHDGQWLGGAPARAALVEEAKHDIAHLMEPVAEDKTGD